MAEVLAANDIVDVIGATLELTPDGGGRFKACCPFHHEKTPSFKINRDRQMFHCFGCGKSGSALGFVMEHEGLSFPEALRKLADRAGVRLPVATGGSEEEDFLRRRLIELGTFARRVWRECLEHPLRGSVGRQYLKTRELRPETVARFGLGFAPDDWSTLTDLARKEGYRDNALEASGLVRRGERGSLYDFFRNRLMIPIVDVSGNVVAFGGRDLGDDGPKYINSPENILYKKARVLYGLNEAREALRAQKRAIMVEGYFDLMRCFDAGIENVVAPCGTALTDAQAKLIRRYVPEVVVVFDADPAGIRAALRGVGILTDAGLTVRAMTLPSGKDPDDYIRAQGARAFHDLVDTAPDFVTFYIRMSESRTGTIEGRTDVARELFDILAGLNDELRREEYLKRTAQGLGLNEWTCRGEFSKHLREQAAAEQRPQAVRPEGNVPEVRRVTQDDMDFVAALLSDERMRQEARADLEGLALPDGALTELVQALFEVTGVNVVARLESEDARALYAAAANCPDPAAEKAREIVRKRLARLKRDALKAEQMEVLREIREAERAADSSRVVALMRRKADISQKLDRVAAGQM